MRNFCSSCCSLLKAKLKILNYDLLLEELCFGSPSVTSSRATSLLKFISEVFSTNSLHIPQELINVIFLCTTFYILDLYHKRFLTNRQHSITNPPINLLYSTTTSGHCTSNLLPISLFSQDFSNF